MISILWALLPIFGLIALGFVFRRGGFPGDSFWPQCERLIYFVLFPALLIDRLSAAPLGDLQIGPLAAAIVCAVLAVGAATWLVKLVFGLGGANYGTLFMSGVRFNTYVGIAAAEVLWHGPGASLAALVLAIWVPLVNFLSVWVLTRHQSPGGSAVRAVPRTLLAVAILFAALPGSPAAYILARQLGGDGRLMAGVITLTTVASAVTLPGWIALAN